MAKMAVSKTASAATEALRPGDPADFNSLSVTGLVDGEGPSGCGAGVWFFGPPTGLIEARTHQEFEIACAAIDRVSRDGHVILLVDYEVGSWFEPKLRISTEGHTWAPIQAWLFAEAKWLPHHAFEKWFAESLGKNHANQPPSGVAGVRAAISEVEYLAAVQSALEYIAAGEIYQVNLTWRIDFTFFGSALSLYRKLRRSQPVNHGAYLRLPGRTILSLSPELFIQRQGNQVVAKPMKGTAAKVDKDGSSLAEALERSEKDRAENLMIVDLIRNDLGKIAETGSVRVDHLFRIEEYPTVYQMVSQVSARIPDRSLYRTLEALFPSGSVTGAPKIRAMTIISELERSSRGIYTGTIGHIRPGGDFSFNVAIRTVELTPGNRGRMHVGSGIVADSSATAEYAECWSKARFLTALESDFMLLETLLVDNGTVMRFKAHLERLKQSAQFFGFKYDEAALRETLLRTVATTQGQCRLRLTLNQNGQVGAEIQPLLPLPTQPAFVIASERTDSSDLLLHHKTTARKLYDDTLEQLKARPSVFDALFFNEKDELTEGARSNVFLIKNGTWFTPEVESGLLNGIMRQEILNIRTICEQKLYREDLMTADAVYLSNSLRGLLRVSITN